MEDYKKTHEWWEDWPTTNGTRLPQTGITTLESWDNIMDSQRKIIQKTDLSFASDLAYTYGACLCSSLRMLQSFKERLSSPKGAKRMRFGLGCPFYHFSILLAAVSIPSCLSIFVSPKRCEQKFLRPEVVGCFLPARILPWSYDQLNLNALNFGFEWVKKNINRIKDVRPKKNGWSFFSQDIETI